MPITGLAIAAGIGLAKSELVDKPKEKRQRKLAAETQRLSPWTGMKADKIEEADPIGTAAQFGITGAAMGSGMQRDANASKYGGYASNPTGYPSGASFGSNAAGTAASPYSTGLASTDPDFIATYNKYRGY